MSDEIIRLLTGARLDAINSETGLPEIEQRLRGLAEQLNGADPLRRAIIREMLVDRLRAAKIGGAAKLIDAALPAAPAAPSETQGQAVAFADPEPWPQPVDGAELLERVRQFATRYLELPAGGDVLLPAFAVYTYAADAFATAPYVVLHSPAPQCGKTRALELLELLVRRGWRTIVPSTAVLFRVLEAHEPTLLLDEAEVVRGRGDAAQDVRALLQSGYRRGAFVPRCVGDDNEVRNFRVFGAKVFALIGELPAALFDRCIPVEMQRRPRGQGLARFRPRRVEGEALELRRMARRWAEDYRDQLASVAVPALHFLDERAEEIWEPLLAVGIVAGGDWYDRLHDAARQLSGGRSTTSAGVELLADIHAIFDARGVDLISSTDLAGALNELEGQRWADWNNGKGVTPNGVARLLKAFGIAPTKSGDWRGYKRDYFSAAWEQYSSQPPNRPESSNDGHYLADGNRPTKESEGGCETPGNLHGDRLRGGWAVQTQGEAGPGLFDGDVPPGDSAPEDLPDEELPPLDLEAAPPDELDPDEATRTCPRGHQMWHRPGSPPHEGWVCCTCHPAAARALGWREGATPPGRDSAGRRVLRRIR